jgi:recombination protein RecA
LSEFTDSNIRFFSSGSTLLDLALGGGWAVPRIFNIVGDKSSGKTLQAIEAFANFKLTFPNGRMRYAEVEAAFDEVYADILGFPEEVERPDPPLRTVSDFEKDFYNFIKKDRNPCLYILDSLDAISSETQMENFLKRMDGEKEKGSMGAEKAKDLSEMFRNIAMEMKKYNGCLGIISQIRDKVGVMFGETKTRSGGRALDFYATHVLWLAEIKKNERTSLGVKRIVSVDVEGYVKKNKVGMPFRKAQWTLVFCYGVDDEISILNWMKQNKQLTDEAYKVLKNQVETAREKKDFKSLLDFRTTLKADVTRIWKQIEKELAPPIHKYGNPVIFSPPPELPPPPPLKKIAEEAKAAIDSVVDTVEESKRRFNLGSIQLPARVSTQKDDVAPKS